MYHLILFTSAILYPVEVNIAEAAPRDTARSKVKIFVDIHIKNGIEINEVLVERRLERIDDVRIFQPLFQLRRLDGVEDDTLDVVSNQHFTKLEHLQHRTRRIVGDRVSLEDIFGARDFPGEPALTEGRVHAKYVRQVTHFAAAAVVVVLDTFRDSFHLKKIKDT